MDLKRMFRLHRTIPATLILLALGVVSVASAQGEFVRGDVNRDSRVTPADAAAFVGAFMGSRGLVLPNFDCQDAADVDDNGQISLTGGGLGRIPSDFDALMAFLLSLAPTVDLVIVVPPPFPTAGLDPTKDDLGCTVAAGDPPGPTTGLGMSWEVFPPAITGPQPISFVQRVTTQGPVGGFSGAWLINNKFVEIVDVNFDGTVVPAKMQETLEDSRFFQWRFLPTTDPDYALLLVIALFVEQSSKLGDINLGPKPLDFSATQGPLNDAPFLNIDAFMFNPPDEDDGVVNVVEPFPDNMQPFGGLAAVENGFVGMFDDMPGDLLFDEGEIPPIPAVSNGGELIFPNEEEIFLRGDSNSDRSVTVSDATYTIGYLFVAGEVPLYLNAADANDDEEIDISDIMLTLWHLFEGATLPAPFPSCGIDPPGGAEFLFPEPTGDVRLIPACF